MKKVLKFCKEGNEKGSSRSFTKSDRRVEKSVGRSVPTVRNVCRDCDVAERGGAKLSTSRKTQVRRRIRDVHDFDKCALRRIFLQYYEDNKEIPTFPKLLSSVKETIRFEAGETSLENYQGIEIPV
jgi:hypothetical protein